MASSLSRLAGLDGLRALAILLTLWMHLEMNGWLQTGLPLAWGRQGVCLFFVLSGYLITRILLTGSSWKRFYWRRGWRIFPPFYVYLAVVALLWAAGLYRVRPLPYLAAATYWANFYHSYRGFPLEHTWSLAVEEQYYLVWPMVLWTLGARRCGVLIPATFLIWPLQRWWRTGLLGHPDSQEALFSSTYDLLLWGSLGALLRPRFQPRHFGWALAAAFCLAVLTLATDQLPALLIPPLRGLSMIVFILYLVQHPQGWLVRLLENPALRWLGTRSYSLYLWHILWCDPRWQARWPWPVTVLLALLSAELCYRLVEMPSRRLRDHWPKGECSNQDWKVSTVQS